MNLEDAIADEILAEVGRKRVTAKAVQREVGVSAGSWANYFVTRSRRIPLPVFLDVCVALRVLPEDIIRRAREHREPAEDYATRELLDGLTARQRKVVEGIRSADGGSTFGHIPGDIDEGRVKK